jgi:uncharacterized protein (TIGR00255 family)
VRATSVARDVAPNVDRELARAFVESIGGLGSSLGLEGGLDLRTVLALPGVVTLDEPSEVDDAQGATIRAAVRRALTDVVAMRATEGERLAAELVRLLKKTEALVAAIEKRAPQVAPELRRKLFRRIESLVDGSKVALEPGMLEKEVAVAADRCDVTEELARLASHLAEFRTTLQQKGPVGRQLDFLAQEMGRESNTIGAKNQDLAISRKVIELKAQVERLREQVQNIE